jgi:aminoglycoside phosphotransferase family enzyme/predicted kinase
MLAIPTTRDVPAVVTLADHAQLVAGLLRTLSHETASHGARALETHISSVILTGSHAYKLKKPVALGFCDFTTLAARRFFCEQELRLNRRLAPSLYLGVVPITGSLAAPVVGGTGEAIDCAVLMREFPQEALLPRVLSRGELTASDIDALAGEVARFHAQIVVAPAATPFGTPERIALYARQNFTQSEDMPGAALRHAMAALSRWTERELAARAEAMRDRRYAGFVRECHGDLHLGNIAKIDGRAVIFDCIEFNDDLRFIDVMSEIAFTAMDLADRGRPDLARRFLNSYLEHTGDYAGLAVLRFYLVYRAMVRAKIAHVRAQQVAGGPARAALMTECRGYVVQARRYARRTRPMLVLMHGYSGSGKSTLAQSLQQAIDAVRIRTDVERKRLHGLARNARIGSPVEGGLYTAAATQATYDRVRELATEVLDAGFTAIVDGTFLHRPERDSLRALAVERGVPFVIIDVSADIAAIKERLARRADSADDPSDADVEVLLQQLHTHDPLAPDERAHVVTVPSTPSLTAGDVAQIRAAARVPAA